MADPAVEAESRRLRQLFQQEKSSLLAKCEKEKMDELAKLESELTEKFEAEKRNQEIRWASEKNILERGFAEDKMEMMARLQEDFEVELKRAKASAAKQSMGNLKGAGSTLSLNQAQLDIVALQTENKKLIDELNTLKNNYDNRVRMLKQELTSKSEMEIANLMQQRDIAQSEKADLATKLKELESQSIDKLEDLPPKLQESLQLRIDEEKKKLSSQMTETFQKEKTELLRNIEAEKEKFSAVQVAEIEKLKQTVQTTISEKQSTIGALEAQVVSLKQDLDLKQSAHEVLSSSLKGEVERLTSEAEKYATDLSVANSKLSEQIQNVSGQHQQTETIIKDLKSQLLLSQTEITSKTAEIHDFQTKAEQLQRSLDTANDKLDSAKQDLISLATRNEQLLSKQQLDAAALANAQDELLDARNVSKDLEDKLKEVDSRLKQSLDANVALNSKLESFQKQETVAYQNAEKEYKNALAKAQDEFLDARNASKDLEQKLKEADSRLKHSLDANTALNSKLESFQKESTLALQIAENEHKNAIDASKAENAKLRLEIEELKHSLEALGDAEQTYRSYRIAAESECKEVHSKLANAEHQLQLLKESQTKTASEETSLNSKLVEEISELRETLRATDAKADDYKLKSDAFATKLRLAQESMESAREIAANDLAQKESQILAIKSELSALTEKLNVSESEKTQAAAAQADIASKLRFAEEEAAFLRSKQEASELHHAEHVATKSQIEAVKHLLENAEQKDIQQQQLIDDLTAKLNDSNAKYEAAYATSQASKELLREELARERELVASMKTELALKQEKNEMFQVSINSSAKEANDLKVVLADVSAKLAVAESDVKSTAERLSTASEHQSIIAEQTALISQLERQIAQQVSTEDDMKLSVVILAEQLETSKRQSEDLKHSAEMLRQELDSVRQNQSQAQLHQQSEIEQQLQREKAQSEQLTAELKQLKEELATQRDSFLTLESEYNSSRSETFNLAAEIQALEEALASASLQNESAAGDYKTEISLLQQNQVQLNSLLSEANAEKRRLQDSAKHLETLLGASEEAAKLKGQEAAEVQEELKVLRVQMIEANEQCQMHQQQFAEMRQKYMEAIEKQQVDLFSPQAASLFESSTDPPSAFKPSSATMASDNGFDLLSDIPRQTKSLLDEPFEMITSSDLQRNGNGFGGVCRRCQMLERGLQELEEKIFPESATDSDYSSLMTYPFVNVGAHQQCDPANGATTAQENKVLKDRLDDAHVGVSDSEPLNVQVSLELRNLPTEYQPCTVANANCASAGAEIQVAGEGTQLGEEPPSSAASPDRRRSLSENGDKRARQLDDVLEHRLEVEKCLRVKLVSLENETFLLRAQLNEQSKLLDNVTNHMKEQMVARSHAQQTLARLNQERQSLERPLSNTSNVSNRSDDNSTLPLDDAEKCEQIRLLLKELWTELSVLAK